MISYALIGLNEAIWFVDSAKLSVELIAELATAGVTIQSYDSFAAYVGTIACQNLMNVVLASGCYKVLVRPMKFCYNVRQLFIVKHLKRS